MTATNLWTEQAAGPASYTTGGFVITTTLSTVAGFSAEVEAAAGVPARFVYTLDTPAAGQVTVQVFQETYQLESVGAVSGLPAGVTAAAASGQNVATDTPHSHAIDHDHAITAASTLAAGGSGVMTGVAVGGVNTSTHTHTANLPNHTGTSGTQTHQHTWDHIYQHQHALSTATVDVTLVEVANGTNLSAVLLNFMGVDS